MLYGLQFVPNHPVYRLHVAFGHFLDDGLKLATLGPECFPDWFKPVFKASSGLRERCEAVHTEARKQKQVVRDSVVRVWKSHSEVHKLCEDTKCNLEEWGFKAKKLIKALCDLFNFLYEQTLESKSFEKAVGKSLIDHYNSFRGLGQRVCPFCGLQYYEDRESGTRNAYDHLLARAHYPLAAVNFRNLVPMCDGCNKRPRKGTKDVLFEDGKRLNRRTFYYPFSQPGGIELSVACKQNPSPSNLLGEWKVTIRAAKAAESAQVLAWASVFDADRRFLARIKEGFDGWMKDFLSSRDYKATPTVAQLRQDLAAKAAWWAKPEQLRERIEAGLQAAVLSYMAQKAPDHVLAGWASRATSPAVVKPLTSLSNN
jgi:hypothetical protein